MPVKERLIKYLQKVKKTQTGLAKELGINAKTLNSIVLGNSKPGYKVLEPLAKFGVNINWLLTGEGEMFQEGEKKIIAGDGNLLNIGQHNNNTNTVHNAQAKDKEIVYLKEQIQLLKSQLEDKERLIKMYEAQNK